MFGFLKKKKSQAPIIPITTDIHSHLIPGVDDGVQSIEESMDLLKEFANSGYSKVITTPHIMAEVYPNKESDLIRIHHDLKKQVEESEINIIFELAAEYFLDDHLYQRVKDGDELLTFGDNYLLFETGFINKPLYLNDFIFQARSKGYKPVLAHPERYQYIISDSSLLQDLRNRDVLFQMNLNSLVGYYSKPVKKLAEKLIDTKLIDFIGSDCHNMRHFEVSKKARESKYYQKALALPLLNRAL